MRGIKKNEIVIDGVKYIYIRSMKKDDEKSWNKCEHFVKHKKGEPICWEDGTHFARRFYLNGKVHRDDGPALIMYTDKDFNKLERMCLYTNGDMTKALSEEEIQNENRKNNLNKILE